MTQQELAAALGVASATVSRWRSKGLLAACAGGGHGGPLRFGPVAVERAKIVRELRREGHSLRDAVHILGQMDVEDTWEIR